MGKYAKGIEQDDGYSDWVEPADLDAYQVACCDCGLVHTFQLQAVAVKRGKGGIELVSPLAEKTVEGEDITVILRAKRNNRATGQIRRRKRVNGERLNYE